MDINSKNKIDVLIPSLDSELQSCIEIQDVLKNIGISTLLPSLKSFKKTKEITGIFGHKGKVRDGLTLPKTVRSDSIESFKLVGNSIGYPFVAKGVINNFCGSPTVVFNKSQLPYIWEYYDSHGFESVISKKFLKGEEFSVSGVCDRKHELKAHLSIKKLLQCEQGNTWAARKISLPELENGIKNLLKEIKWVGPVELEFIRDSFDEEFKLIEINCRFPAWISYAKDVGYNLPLIAVDLALEQKSDNFFKKDDLIFIRNCNEFSADRVQFGKFLKTEIIDNEKR